MDSDKIISKAVEDSSTYFLIKSVARFGFSDGYLVENEGEWFCVDSDFERVRKLPNFIRSRDDALGYIDAADVWYREGLKDGEDDAKREFRRWLGI